MKFQNVRTLVDQIFSTKVQFVGYGDDTPQTEANAVAEQELITNFGAPTIDLGFITFSSGVNKDVDGNIVIDENSNEKVSFVINAQKVEVKEGFVVTYSCNSKRVDPSEITKATESNPTPVLGSAQKVAEAKCVVFEEKIALAIKTAIANLKASKTKFDDVVKSFVI